MQVFDISVPVFTGMVSYPGDPGAAIEPVSRIAQGDTANLSLLRLGSHTGTHVDAPHHFENGRATIDRVPLEVLMGPARVVDLSGVDALISRQDLEEAGAAGAPRLLIKTSNSRLWANPEFATGYVSLEDDAADWLVDEGIKLVGADYLSIERFKSDEHYIHHRLLGAGVIIVEGLDLIEVEAGDYELACLPLKILDGDGSPARAVLVKR